MDARREGLDLGTLIIRYKGDEPGLRAELNAGEREVKDSGQRIANTGKATARQWAEATAHAIREGGVKGMDGLWRSADGRLRDAKGRFAAAATEIGRAAGDAAGAGIRFFGTAAGNASTGVTNLTTNIYNWIPAILAAVAALALLAPATQLVGGLLGALPALATGGLAAIATLAIGFMGLDEAFKKTNRSGGSVVDRARQVMLAERRVADANREVLASQLSLNKAREQAAERLRDLTRNLAGARLDEADAMDAVAKARNDLERATEGGNADQIRAAERNLARALQSLDDVRDRVEDLAQEQAEAHEQGVEGSDLVTSALERQRKAVEGVQDAQYELRRAQQPTGGGGGADEPTKLAASALAAIAVIKGLKGKFEELRLDIQQRLFAGSDKEIDELWKSWEPTLKARLGGMADMFSGLFKKWAATSKKPEFIANISAGWEHVQRLIDRVFSSVAGPGLEAFGKLSSAAGPVLDALGNGLGKIIDDFARWIDESEDSGELTTFFEDAGRFIDNTFRAGTAVASIFGSILDILMRSTDETRDASADGFVESLEAMAAWFDDPENQAMVEEWFDNIEEAYVWIKDTAIPTIVKWKDKLDGWADRVGGWIQKAKDFRDDVKDAFNKVESAAESLKKGIDKVNIWAGFTGSAKAAFNAVADLWNSSMGKVSFTLPSWVGGALAGKGWGFPTIPRLAQGGFMKAIPGGHVVNVAEAGEDEIVSPVEMMRRIVSEELERVKAEDGPTVIELHTHVGDEVTSVVRYEIDEHDRKVKREVLAGAGVR